MIWLIDVTGKGHFYHIENEYKTINTSHVIMIIMDRYI